MYCDHVRLCVCLQPYAHTTELGGVVEAAP